MNCEFKQDLDQSPSGLMPPTPKLSPSLIPMNLTNDFSLQQEGMPKSIDHFSNSVLFCDRDTRSRRKCKVPLNRAGSRDSLHRDLSPTSMNSYLFPRALTTVEYDDRMMLETSKPIPLQL